MVTSKELLIDAKKHKYAVGAFNVENMEMVKAVLAAAEELQSPVILQTTPSTIKYASVEMFAAMVIAETKNISVPVCLHLDHGNSYELAISALKAGYTSIMIDGSKESFEENISITKRVVEEAKKMGIPVEAELGKVGGKEDEHEVLEDTNTDTLEAIIFVKRTEIDSLAVAIGTAHGFYVKEPILDKERLSDIKRNITIPLVLHGASGISESDVKDCIRRGICKVNIATELRVAYSNAVKKVFAENPKVFDPKTYGNAGMQAVKEVAKEKMYMCGSNGKANNAFVN